MFKMTFSDVGTFKAWYARQNWLDEHGYSYGSTSARASGVGVLKGDYCIAKMHNLTKEEIQELDGIVSGDFRDGPVVLTLKVEPEQLRGEKAE